jgi:hypothetical protein
VDTPALGHSTGGTAITHSATGTIAGAILGTLFTFAFLFLGFLVWRRQVVLSELHTVDMKPAAAGALDADGGNMAEVVNADTSSDKEGEII